jgi:hypothetical protein
MGDLFDEKAVFQKMLFELFRLDRCRQERPIRLILDAGAGCYLCPLLVPGLFNQNAPHGFGSCGKEVPLIFVKSRTSTYNCRRLKMNVESQ